MGKSDVLRCLSKARLLELGQQLGLNVYPEQKVGDLQNLILNHWKNDSSLETTIHAYMRDVVFPDPTSNWDRVFGAKSPMPGEGGTDWCKELGILNLDPADDGTGSNSVNDDASKAQTNGNVVPSSGPATTPTALSSTSTTVQSFTSSPAASIVNQVPIMSTSSTSHSPTTLPNQAITSGGPATRNSPPVPPRNFPWPPPPANYHGIYPPLPQQPQFYFPQYPLYPPMSSHYPLPQFQISSPQPSQPAPPPLRTSGTAQNFHSGRHASNQAANAQNPAYKKRLSINFTKECSARKIKFTGKASERVSIFMEDVEEVIDFLRLPDEDVLAGFMCLLEGPARAHFKANKNRYISWDDVKKDFIATFGPFEYDPQDSAKMELRTMMDGETIDTYLSVMTEINKRLRKPKSKAEFFERMMINLAPAYRTNLRDEKITNIKELREAGQRYELIRIQNMRYEPPPEILREDKIYGMENLTYTPRQKSNFSGKFKSSAVKTEEKENSSDDAEETGSEDDEKLSYCAAAKLPPSKLFPSSAKTSGVENAQKKERPKLSEVRCYKCNKYGHYASGCPEGVRTAETNTQTEN